MDEFPIDICEGKTCAAAPQNALLRTISAFVTRVGKQCLEQLENRCIGDRGVAAAAAIHVAADTFFSPPPRFPPRLPFRGRHLRSGCRLSVV